MQKNGYALVRNLDAAQVARWEGAVPAQFKLPDGGFVCGADERWSNAEFVIVPVVWEEPDPPAPEPVPEPPPPPPSFLARDLFALLTPDDYAKISVLVASDPAIGLLWASMLAQGDAPIRLDSARTISGLERLTAALGKDRIVELFAALHLPGNSTKSA